jgi:cellulose synthase/poly-beta-1,6-N-acetylglucosamine synthase-like glycosyltransferase
MEFFFWLSLAAVCYAYIGYPLLLLVINRVRPGTRSAAGTDYLPSVTMIIPVHNEQNVIGKKIDNLLGLDYPVDLLDILIVSDGSTDATREIVEQKLRPPIRFSALPARGGKAAALNAALQQADNEIVVFSDASILLEKDALRHIVNQFQDSSIGCVSGEDRIAGASGEGAYGAYELFLRRQESQLFSIVGASGSFYAQRQSLCEPFQEGAAPDFLSVLQTVEKGYRAVTEPAAVGTMTAVKRTGDEFNRKVRTLIRGMTALFRKPRLLNPLRRPLFAFTLISHKIMRWLVPFFLVALLVANLLLLDSGFFRAVFLLQLFFYLLAGGAALGLFGLQRTMIGKIPLYFVAVNIAILVAWLRYLRGVRQEIWSPSSR